MSPPIITFNFVLLPTILLLLHSANTFALPVFDSIYQFGDSLSDTGNFKREQSTDSCSKPPYGQTADFFDHPTGRCSDGLLIVDFIARSFGLPLLKPYLEEGADFGHGVNFAVAGCTAMDPAELAHMNITPTTSTNSSLSVQLRWFKAHLHSSCSSTTTTAAATEECKQKMVRKALVMMGEIGGNDYNYPLCLATKSVEDLYSLVPHVIAVIKDAVQEVIDLGATQLVVPGNFPIGCLPAYLQLYASNDTAAYDELKCLKHFNSFASFHNQLLQQTLAQLRLQNPSVSIYYGDYYHAFRWLLRNAASLGFEEDGVFKACCGKGDNDYNCDSNEQCGTEGVPVCSDPAKRLSWDGLHLTQQAYKHLADWLLSDMFSLPSSPSCSNLEGDNLMSSAQEECTYKTTY
ncbi:hypothetical protein V2J09_006152 [Rumex salicifolius]